ncbi:MAG: acetyl/propionyl/methylcrotonyl-CoA carboxylase subunit alpha [Pseudomonadota bacterium]|nr:acetyl/propionyl/methylcrotonyl-CoA carboxylase subunit alpha [Pseudomonadota bacterium]
MFKKILVANRGEIACRVIRTARRMGIGVVSVYSEADRDALHTQSADQAVLIGGAAAAESYLDAEKIIAACKQTGAEAVHPGYGFLSENAAFARRLKEEGIAFIGPGPGAIEAMGDKITSKRIAEEAGVNTIPGHGAAIKDAEEAVEIARGVGYPVMIKASAGGGGKGMRIARDDEECRDGFARSSSEAASSFGDDRVFIEKYIEQPRHIEIQLIADAHGNVVTLNERECSIQRRHQKVVEEAPSPLLDETTRKAMSEQAALLAGAVDYRSAGTVEFIADNQRNFYFLEMNTRLQVEHPVTEMITGLDLVELMIRVAAGEPLPVSQQDIGINGWSMETRVYAENPFRGFLPSTGRLTDYQPPRTGEQVRVDAGVFEGAEISVYYDPMIAKLVTWGEDRDAALAAMRRALDEYYIRGVETNIPFLASIAAHPRFMAGDLSTDFIADVYPDGFRLGDIPCDDPSLFSAVAAAIHRRHVARAAATSGQLPGYERVVDSKWVAVLNGESHPLKIIGDDSCCTVEIGGETYRIEDEWAFGQPLFRGTVNGVPLCIQMEREVYRYRLSHHGCHAEVSMFTACAAELNRLMPFKEPPDSSKFLLSPMPGLLISLAVEVGQEVKQGAELAVIEAMKMENSMRAEQDGTVARLLAEPGQSLEVDQPIIEFE